MIRPQFSLDLNDELIVDNFAGGGGASCGIELALGRHVDIAINHNREAVAMHQANHPQTRHLIESVWDVDPVKEVAGRRVGLAWFSPDCKHFSKAKGGKPRDKKIRALAWVVLNWVVKLGPLKPRVIILENVEEFQTWCPCQPDGQPSKWRKGWTFQCFIGALRRRGYEVDWRELRACDYGAPTIRKRLFLIARCDGRPIVWPEPTHAAPDRAKALGLKPWRTAAECIDWSIPCPSIFERKRPLADATCRRIAKGIMRYMVNAAEPFIVHLTHHGTDRVQGLDQPVPTVTAAHRGEMALVSPVITEHANAKHERVFDPQEPLRTQCAQVKGGHFALVSAFLAKHYSGVVGIPATEPTGTVTSTDHHSVVSSTLIQTGYGERDGQPPRAPGIEKPLGTAVAGGVKHAVVAATLTRQFGTSNGAPVDAPLGTIMADGAGGKTSLVEAFLVKYYGTDQDPNLREPLHTVTSKDRFGLVTVKGVLHAIIDIGLRMLAPRELFRAQGFPDSYVIGDNPAQGLTLSKSAQVRMVGNSVCPPLAEALVWANAPEMAVWTGSELRRRMA